MKTNKHVKRIIESFQMAIGGILLIALILTVITFACVSLFHIGSLFFDETAFNWLECLKTGGYIAGFVGFLTLAIFILMD